MHQHFVKMTSLNLLKQVFIFGFDFSETYHLPMLVFERDTATVYRTESLYFSRSFFENIDGGVYIKQYSTAELIDFLLMYRKTCDILLSLALDFLLEVAFEVK